MRELITELTAGAQTEAQAFENFSWNLLVLRHEAERLGIRPDTTEIANAVKALPAFGGENGFDLTRYTDFTDRALAPMGFSEKQIEELAADQIILERVKKILSAGVAVPEAELRSSFEQAYAKMDASVVRFRFEDFAQEAQINDTDIAKYYEAQKTQLKTDEKRRIKFVRFGLTDEQKKTERQGAHRRPAKTGRPGERFYRSAAGKGRGFRSGRGQVPTHAQGDGRLFPTLARSGAGLHA
jgi:hypothetical protein